MYEQIEKNKRKTFLIILFFVVFIIFLGWIFGEFTQIGPLGIVFAFFFSLFSVWGSYFYSDKIVLKISGAKPVKREDDPHLFHTVEGLSIAAGIPQPKAYVIESPALNAFATG
ncbi:MAG: zinc metalloprotease HtpX, partial [Actinomycetia bacterium]|nr:zinc metalloprotease HtpX [Actinomycetes bacterium]